MLTRTCDEAIGAQSDGGGSVEEIPSSTASFARGVDDLENSVCVEWKRGVAMFVHDHPGVRFTGGGEATLVHRFFVTCDSNHKSGYTYASTLSIHSVTTCLKAVNSLSNNAP